MYHYALNRITVASILDIRKANKNSQYPVKIRVTYQRTRKYFTTGKAMSEVDWSALPTTKSKAAADLRRDIQLAFDLVKAIVHDLIAEGAFSFDLLAKRLGRGHVDTLNKLLSEKISDLAADERIGTKNYYVCALNSIERFSGKDISVFSITPDWLRRYEKWMLSQEMSYTTIGMYQRAIRSMLNVAKDSGIIKPAHYPFGRGKYEIPTGEGRKLALSLPQIKELVSFDDGTVAAKYRDLWYMSYLANGINMSDLLALKYGDIVDGEISFYRTKTIRTSKKKRAIVAIVTPEIEAIIEKWGNSNKSPENYIFPYLDGADTAARRKVVILDVIRRINRALKRIGSAIGIPGITTYSARHSFATVLKRSGADVSFIAESLGHPNPKTTQAYLDSFEKDERVKNAKLLTRFKN